MMQKHGRRQIVMSIVLTDDLSVNLREKRLRLHDGSERHLACIKMSPEIMYLSSERHVIHLCPSAIEVLS